MEGTDAVIRRAGELARGRLTVIKIAKPDQDMRFDVPVIGVATVAIAKEAKLRVIAIEAGRTLLLEQEALVESAARANISIVAR